ncbi:MAG TPA: glycosyltransferase family 39 protein, partial [Verrucomicrobiae bacterium]|nr:glycosyltransferase family 39 protein [Verrucomicrobiae bacterium]
GTYFAYAVGMAIFGQSISGIHALLLAVNLLTIYFVFLLGRDLFDEWAGACAAVIFGIASASSTVLGMAAHANHFVILFAVPALWLLWRCRRDQTNSRLFMAGLLFGVSFLMKQQAVFFLLFGFVFFLAVEFSDFRSRSRDAGPGLALRRSSSRGSLLGLAMALPLALTCIYLAAAGVFPKFYFWVFRYARQYVSVASAPDGLEFLRRYLSASSSADLGFRLLALFGFCAALTNSRARQRVWFLAGLAFASCAAVAVGLYFRPHYFILALPVMALLGGYGAAELRGFLTARIAGIRSRPALATVLPLLAVLVAAGESLWAQRDVFFRLTPRQIVERNYPDNPFIESLAVADYLRKYEPTNATLAVIGSEPQIYFYSGLRSATGYIYGYPLMERQPYAARMQQEMIREIEDGKPDCIVRVNYENSWAPFPDSNRSVFEWCGRYLRQNYRLAGYVGQLPSGKLVAKWDGADARPPASLDCLLVFRRNEARSLQAKADGARDLDGKLQRHKTP